MPQEAMTPPTRRVRPSAEHSQLPGVHPGDRHGTGRGFGQLDACVAYQVVDSELVTHDPATHDLPIESGYTPVRRAS